MEFLKDILGDKYDEFMELLGDVQLKIDDGEHMIPKSRFDEINNRMKKAEKELNDFKQSQMTEEEKIQAIIDQAEREKKELATELSKVKVSELFAKNGLGEETYLPLVDSILSEDLEKTMATANLMINTIKDSMEKTKEEVEKGILDRTPTPPVGGKPQEPKTLGETFAEKANQRNVETKTIWD